MASGCAEEGAPPHDETRRAEADKKTIHGRGLVDAEGAEVKGRGRQAAFQSASAAGQRIEAGKRGDYFRRPSQRERRDD